MTREVFRSANVLNSFAVSSWMPVKTRRTERSILFQNESPGKDKEAKLASGAEWSLPSDTGPYSPKSEAQNRKMDIRHRHENAAGAGGRSDQEANTEAPGFGGRHATAAKTTNLIRSITMLTKRDLLSFCAWRQ